MGLSWLGLDWDWVGLQWAAFATICSSATTDWWLLKFHVYPLRTVARGLPLTQSPASCEVQGMLLSRRCGCCWGSVGVLHWICSMLGIEVLPLLQLHGFGRF